MERRHQVFVSSTYADLVLERQHVIHALLELDCFPAGMEMFPAADEDAWSLITGVIDDSDYYILILGGRYGSADSSGVSYTEREYDYAVSRGKPVMAFLHANPGIVSADKTESTDLGRQKLAAFRAKAQARHCKFWENPDDLGGKVSRALVQMRKRHPAPGWVPGKFAADEAMLRKMEELRSRVAELEQRATSPAISAPASAKDLEQGDDPVSIGAQLKTQNEGKAQQIVLTSTWDKVFAYLGPSLGGECGEDVLEEKLRLCFWHAVPTEIRGFNNFKSIVIAYVMFDSVKVQLQALGLMMPGTKRRAVSDQQKYWKLTPYGEQYLIQLQARRRVSTANPREDGDNEGSDSEPPPN